MANLKYVMLSCLLSLMLLPVPSFAKGSVKVGDTIPHDLRLENHEGLKRSFVDLRGKKGIVLVFVRSVEWCPFCQKQLLELNKNAKKFNDLGYPVVTISYDTPPSMSKFVTVNRPKITLLSDPRSEVIRAFGILNENSVIGTRSYGISHPGVYIIDKNKKVQAKFFNEGYQERPSVKVLLSKIKKLNPPPVPYIPPMTIENMGQDPIILGDDVITVPDKIIDPVLLPEEVVEEVSLPTE